MKRKDFLSSVIPLGAVFSDMATGKHISNQPDIPIKIPSYLNPGDTIGICCVAGYITLEEVQSSVNKMKEWGFEIKLGDTVGKRDFTSANVG
jgi:muramoyltetrapeptide carboxypeptidase